MDLMILIAAVAAILVIWNIVTFLIYGLDKRKAQKGSMRISEKTLITVAFLMGGIGAFAGMRFFRHKTDKPKFKLVPLTMVLDIVVIAVLVFFFVL